MADRPRRITLSASAHHRPPTLWHAAPLRAYLGARTAAELAAQVSAVAIGWQVYASSGSALALGLIGLAQFLPTALLSLPAGHAADRCDRRRIVTFCQGAAALVSALLALASFTGTLSVTAMLAAAALLGASAAIANPAAAALLPAVTPEGTLAQGSALVSGAFQFATIAGPALGGLAYAASPGAAYALAALLCLLGALCNRRLPPEEAAVSRADAAAPAETGAIRALCAGLGFVRRTPVLLGTISLDLCAVLLGGASALLPIFARDVLHTGPLGLGMLRAAPAGGALLVALLLARSPAARHAGRRMFQAVIAFGLATVGFALSRSLCLSLLLLALMGAADAVSMVIRGALVQLATPASLRGRVGAVNSLAVHSSSQLGEFESGVTAALLGAVPAALLGGVATVVVALLWMRFFPGLRRHDSLESVGAAH